MPATEAGQVSSTPWQAAELTNSGGRKAVVQSCANLPPFLVAENLKPYVSQANKDLVTDLIEYHTFSGQKGYGYQAGILSLTIQADIGLAVSGTPTRDQRPIIACAVLDDGRRVIGREAMLRAIGRSGATSVQHPNEDLVCTLPGFLAADNLKPYVSKGIGEFASPVVYRTLAGKTAHGYAAELLAETCGVYVTANAAGVLTHKQRAIAVACQLLLVGFARLGLIALIDEATAEAVTFVPPATYPISWPLRT